MMEEHVGYKTYGRVQEEDDDLDAIQAGPDELYQKVQDNVHMNIAHWEEYCDRLEAILPERGLSADPPDGTRDGDADRMSSSSDDSSDSSPGLAFTEEEQEAALEYWRKRLAAAERKSSQIDGEILSLERTLKVLEAGRAAVPDADSDCKLSKEFEDVVKAAVLLEQQLKQRYDILASDPNFGLPWVPPDEDDEAEPDSLLLHQEQEDGIGLNPDRLASVLSLAHCADQKRD